jgi:hypothetical protein
MISPTQLQVLDALRELLDFSDTDMRVGQLLFNLGWLNEGHGGYCLREIEDDELLAAIARHRADLWATGRRPSSQSNSDSQPLLMEHA